MTRQVWLCYPIKCALGAHVLISYVEGDYIDLIQNPERFTGYAGLSANRVWSSIYNENCFGISEHSLMSGYSPAKRPDVFSDPSREDDTDSSEECLEKRVYYKIISGMIGVRMQINGCTDILFFFRDPGLHASISTHLCYEHLDQSTGEWVQYLSVNFALSVLTHYYLGTQSEVLCISSRIASGATSIHLLRCRAHASCSVKT